MVVWVEGGEMDGMELDFVEVGDLTRSKKRVSHVTLNVFPKGTLMLHFWKKSKGNSGRFNYFVAHHSFIVVFQ